ncbi:hypothetical protein [Faecalibaculum rodentium]|uniref:hypothetical protein n=1 Tax=Faecalibaculum rodentium TaxID=1702221 RepID=UPI0023F48558|nr:hypothetical protein [Faecalibaculum rodentium]
MTKIETLVKLIDQSSINCHGVYCRECPFDGLPGGRSRCALLNLDLDGADVEGNIKNAIFDAVDEARKEETEPTVGQIWKRKSGFGDPVEITRIVNNLDGTKGVRYSMDDGQFMSGAILEDFLKWFEKCELETTSHTTPDHSNQAPDYYRRNFKGVEIQVNDITHLWELDADETQAVQYILRAKYKNSGSDELQDLRKAVDMLNMAIGWKEFG